jgi:UDP-GlcNAc:undecaprenyl-phosphate/decaprenyl-phosphate GlcNAc-1-phosphate transferase
VFGYGVVLGVAAVGTWILTFGARWAAVRCGAVVAPDERRVHDRPTPTGGGAAMFVAFLAAMAVASRLHQFRGTFRGSSEPLGVVLAASVMFAVGLLDDLREVSAPAKMAGQVFAASVLYLFGVTMLYFQVPSRGFIVLSSDLEPLVTVIWVVAIANAINFIDGLDGLAAGIVAIGALAFFLYSDRLFKAGLLPPESVGPLVAIICCGVCVGFLPHNFHRAKIFMGDAGALFLGLLMAASTMVVGGHTVDQFSGRTFFFFAPIFIPFFILGVPIIDTAFAILRRARTRTSPASADKQHLHHRLMQMGHGHRRSVIILWAWTVVLSGLVLFPTYTKRGNALIPVGVAGLLVLLYTLFHPGLRVGRPRGGAPESGDGPSGPRGGPSEAEEHPVSVA